MTWVKLAEEFVDHPKLAQLGDLAPLAGWQLVAVLSYCNRYLTDGHISWTKADTLVAWRHVGLVPGGSVDGEVLCQALVNAGLLEDCTDHEACFRVHDYLEYQPSRAEVERERAQTRERVSRHRSRNAERNAVTNGGVTDASVSVPVSVSEALGKRGAISPNSSARAREGPQHIASLLPDALQGFSNG